MNNIEDILSDLSELQKYIILLLFVNNKESIKGHTWFQKELFLIARNIKELDEEASFSSDMYGPYSENANDQLEELELDELIKKDGNKISISNTGLQVAKKLEQETPVKIIEMISDFKDLLNDLNDEEVLAFVYFTFPKFTEESLVIDKIKKKRKELALKIYKKGKISLQRASEIAGMPLEKFIVSV